jgi:class 3 adenylate cyclase/tetratricopeptide (TPR) repeat protein
MRCSRCAAENAAGMKFCGQCAAPLFAACPACGAVNPAENRYCGNCATRLDGSGARAFAEAEPGTAEWSAQTGGGALGGEMKQVSVLFCDIVNSTGLTERIGAEAMRELIGRFLELSTDEIRRYGGVLPQFTGDGFMAVFGAPHTYEDHVRRALLAALAIRRRLGGEAGAVEHGEFKLPVRIGIHSGPVVFGRVGGSFGIETAIGDTANVAARLQQATEPGAILVSETTRSAAQSYIRAEPIGPLAIRGKTEPVSAYRLVGISRLRSTRDGVAPGRTTSFIDRVDEVAALLSFVEQAECGRGLVVDIIGDPGIGKSRVLEELRRQLVPRRVTWAEGRCLSYGSAIPYLLVLDLFRSNCGIVETDTPEIITQKVRSSLRIGGMDPDQAGPVLLHLLGIKTTGERSANFRPETIKEKAFEILRELAVAGSRRRPLMIVLEDLHWIDALSEEFVKDLAELVGEMHILIIATYRPDYRPPWSGKPYSRQIALQPLTRDHSLHIVYSVLRNAILADPVMAEIVAKADGNPLFLEQLALHAGEAKSRRPELMVPATIHDVVMARIDRLPEETKRLLQTAAVIGREFSFRLIRAVSARSGPIDAGLRELCRLEFLDEWPDDDGTIFIFRHALTQEAAYGSLLERDRQSRHADIGRALETLYVGRTDEVVELLALHFGRSSESEKAVDYAIAAAEKSQRRWANNDALSHFDQALRRLETMADTRDNRLRRIDVVLKQAELKYSLGQSLEQINNLQTIYEIVEESEDYRRRATWHYWIGFLHGVSGSRPEIAIEHCRQAAEIAADPELDEINAFAESCLAQVYMVAGKLHDAIEVGERALVKFESQRNRWWAGRTLWHLTAAANYLGEWERSQDYCRRGLEHGIALQDLRLKVVGWSRLGLAYIQQGNFECGIHCCDEALALTPIPRDAAWARVVRGYGKIKAGDLDTGVAELSEALAWFEGAHMRWTQVIGTVWLAEGHLRRGDRASARPLIEHVLETSRATGYLQYEGRGCWLMGEYLAGEAPHSAEGYFTSAILIFERIGARNDLARAMFSHAILKHNAKDFVTSNKLVGEAAAIFHSLGTRDEIVRAEAALAEFGRSAS